MKTRTALAIASLLTLIGCAVEPAAASDLKIDFQQHIAPLIREKCMPCHDDDLRQGELRLNNRANLLRGGVSGKAVAPGDSSASLLIERISGSERGPQMPLTGPLSQEEIERFRAWIDQDAPWDGPLEAAPKPLLVPAEAAALFAAVRRNDGKAVAAALDAAPALISSRDEDGSSPLMLASIYGDAVMMRDLLGRDADANAKNIFGNTALMWVADDFDKANLLVDSGADVNARDEDGFTPAMAAVQTPAGFRTLHLLIENGADIKAALANGTNLLHMAAGAGALRSVELLMQKGLDVNSRRRNGSTALISALAAQRTEVAEFLLKNGADPNLTQRDGSSAIDAASLAGDLASVKLLQKAGANVNQRGLGGYTPLMWAAYSYQPNYQLVGWLLDHGADVTPAGRRRSDRPSAGGTQGRQEIAGNAGRRCAVSDEGTEVKKVRQLTLAGLIIAALAPLGAEPAATLGSRAEGRSFGRRQEPAAARGDRSDLLQEVRVHLLSQRFLSGRRCRRRSRKGIRRQRGGRARKR